VSKRRILRKLGLAASVETAASLTVKVRTRLLLHWARIAVEQDHLARAARAALAGQVEEARREGKGLDLDSEMHPAMIGVAAAAHALEALYGEIRDLVQPESVEAWERTRKSGRWSEVQGAIALGFEVEPNRWRSELRHLFRLRNAAVHPKTAFSETEAHPLGVNTAPEYVAYSAETATDAVGLLLEILTVCVDVPREPLRAWAEEVRGPVQALAEECGVLRCE
jgi:hypothetical protein